MGAWKVAESVWLDVRHACRRLRKERTFALAALLTIALAVALNTAIFSVANAVWLRPLALHEPDRLVAIERPYLANFPLKTWASIPDFLDWRDRAHSFQELAMADWASGSRVVETPAGRRREQISFVSANLFRVLGAAPLLGRVFTDGEGRGTAGQVAVLTEDLWRGGFGADPGIVGKRIVLRADGPATTYEVVGVTPRSFQLEYD